MPTAGQVHWAKFRVAAVSVAAFAILGELAYLLASDRVDLVGVGSVSGNVPAARGAANTLDLLALAGRDDVLLYEGSWSDWAGDPVLPAATVSRKVVLEAKLPSLTLSVMSAYPL